MNYKRGDQWTSISSTRDDRANREYRAGLYSLGLRKATRRLSLQLIRRSGHLPTPVVSSQVSSTFRSTRRFTVVHQVHSQRFEAKIIFLENSADYDRVAEIFAECGSIDKLIFFHARKYDLPNASRSLELENTGNKLKSRTSRSSCGIDRSRSNPKMSRRSSTQAEQPASQRE